MSTATSGAGIGLLGGIAAAVVVVVAGVAGLFYSGALAPEAPNEAPNEAREQVSPTTEAAPAETASEAGRAPQAPQTAPTAETEAASDPQSPAEPAPQVAEETSVDSPLEPLAGTGTEATAEEPETVETETAAPETSEPETAATAEASQSETPPAPSFDIVRVAPDGNSVIAGQGPANTTLTLTIKDGDSVETQTVETDANGKFVLLTTLAPSQQARQLSLSVDGQQLASAQDIIVAPLAAPATPSPTPEAPEAAPQPAQDATDVTVLRADDQGAERLQGAEAQQAQAGQELVLDTISYSAEGDVQLSGLAQSEARIRIYLDNAAIADLTAGVQGRWRTQLRDIAPGLYTLRLDALDSEGKVLSRLETPLKREAPAALAAATSETDAAPEASLRQITVQKGDTLWAISNARYGDGLLYVRVFDANRSAIRNPDLIYPGQIFTLPE